MALRLDSYRLVVPTAGTAVPLSAAKLLVVSFVVRALTANTADVYVGSQTSANSTNGMFLLAGESNEKSPRTTKYGIHQFWDLSKVYLNAAVSGEGAIVEYEVDE